MVRMILIAAATLITLLAIGCSMEINEPESVKPENKFLASVGELGDTSIVRIKQVSSGRYLDAYTGGNGYSAVTRTFQNDLTQNWALITTNTENIVRVLQSGDGGRYLDANTSGGYSAVTMNYQNNTTQHWMLTLVDGDNNYYKIQQVSNGRFLDAYEDASNDYDVVTRTNQDNNTQLWEIE